MGERNLKAAIIIIDISDLQRKYSNSNTLVFYFKMDETDDVKTLLERIRVEFPLQILSRFVHGNSAI